MDDIHSTTIRLTTLADIQQLIDTQLVIDTPQLIDTQQAIDIQRLTDTQSADTLLTHILIDILWIGIQPTDIRPEVAGDTRQDRGTLAAILIDTIRTAIPALVIGDGIHSAGTL